MKSNEVARIGIIAAVYAACTLIALLFLGSLAWAPSSSACRGALRARALHPGCHSGAYARVRYRQRRQHRAFRHGYARPARCGLRLARHVCGRLLYLEDEEASSRGARRPGDCQRLIVPAYLPILLQATGFYTIPFTSISLDGAWPLMYLFGLVTTGAGEAVIMYVLGYPLSKSLARTPYFKADSPFAEARGASH